VNRAKQALAVADLLVVVLDRSAPLDDADRAIIAQVNDYKALIVCNKSDLRAAWTDREMISVSALCGGGIDTLRQRIASALDIDLVRERPEITNVRHIALVQRAHDALERARRAADAVGGALPEEFVLADLQDARTSLEEITGRRAADDVLAHIFTRFCVGK
jgi:tRNA modification GTPase